MGEKRGAENLARFNDERSAHLLPLLKHELQLCRKRKLEFKTPGLLASYLADRLKVHRTTLTRNPRYHGFLLEHLAGQPGAVSRTPDTTTDPAVLQAKLKTAKVEVANLTAQLSQSKALLERIQNVGMSHGSKSEDEVNFSNLAMLVIALLNRFPEFIHLDRDKRELIDLSARPSDRLIAGAERLSDFIQWMEKNKALPLVGALLMTTKKN